MFSYRDSRITKVVLAVFFVCIVAYGYFEARGLLFGPAIMITSQVSVVTDPFITVRGRADRISSLSMNGKSVSVTEAGVFEVPFVLAPGDNHIILDASDTYGRTTKKIIEIVYAPDLPAATTTTTAATSTTP
jgi:Glucodextranase, domain B